MSAPLQAVAAAPAAKEKPAFAWDDPFLFEEQLTEDERLIQAPRGSTRRIACCRAFSRPIATS